MLARALMPRLLMLAAAILAWPVQAAHVLAPVMLVATPQMHNVIYGGSVVLVLPMGEDRHIGFIVNRPTDRKLGQLFPQHPPSQKVPEPVFFGGPSVSKMVFAIVNRANNPGGASFEIARGLFAIFDGATVDRMIESESDHARFFTGLVSWQPGELAQEINRGLWYVAKPDASVVLRKPTQGLWEELVSRLRGAQGAI